jgi:hypothetical protein
MLGAPACRAHVAFGAALIPTRGGGGGGGGPEPPSGGGEAFSRHASTRHEWGGHVRPGDSPFSAPIDRTTTAAAFCGGGEGARPEEAQVTRVPRYDGWLSGRPTSSGSDSCHKRGRKTCRAGWVHVVPI